MIKKLLNKFKRKNLPTPCTKDAQKNMERVHKEKGYPPEL